MRARDAMRRDFRVLDAALSRTQAVTILAQLQQSVPLIVVQRREQTERLYYLFESAALRERLGMSGARDLREALTLSESRHTATIGADEPLDPADGPRVVLDARGPVGVYPSPPRAKRSAERAPVPMADFPSAPMPAPAPAVRRGGPIVGAPAPGAPPAPSAPAEAGPARTPDGERPRFLQAELPASVVAGETCTLAVSLAALARAGGPGAALSLALGSKLELLVEPLAGLELVGDARGELEVTEPQSDAACRFSLKALEPGTGSLLVFAFSDRHMRAKLKVTTSIVARGAASDPKPLAATAQLDVAPRAAPDLSMYISERERELSFLLQSADGALHFKKYGPVTLVGSTQEYFRDLFKDIENLPVDTPERRKIAKRRLEAKGANLFDQLFPSELKAVLWQQRERLKTVQITSDEPWIPWELCRLTHRAADGRVEEGKFFAEAFCITRWLSGRGAPLTLSLDDIALIVPGDSELALAPREKNFVLSLQGPTRKVSEIPPKYLDVTDAMASGRYDAWHFTGHALADARGNADQSQIELEDRAPLTPGELSGQVENILVPQPFVFLNACQSARGGLSLTGLGGWAKRFVPTDSARTASAFIGSYWAVFDETAFAFARALYERLLAGAPIGEAARDARIAVRANEDPTWLAYTVYADPLARVKGAGG